MQNQWLAYQIQYNVIYSIACAVFILVVARFLHRTGAVILPDAFGAGPEVALTVRRMFGAGYFLASMGYVVLTFQTEMPLNTVQQLVQVLTLKIGLLLLMLGALDVTYLVLLTFIRRRVTATPPAM